MFIDTLDTSKVSLIYILTHCLTADQLHLSTSKTAYTIIYLIYPSIGKINALEDVWLLGDEFLQEIIPTLQGLKTQATMTKKSPPYLYEYFNIFAFYTLHNQFPRNILTRIQNALIEAFNRREKLPKYIFVLLDKDLVQYANSLDLFNYGIKDVLAKWISWFLHSVDKHLNIRKDDLFNKRPGAFAGKDPKIIWVKMLDRPHVAQSDQRFKTQSLTSKFNALIDDVVKNRKDNLCMELGALEHNRHYAASSQVNQFGKMQYWKELDYYFKRFDRHEINLRPRSSVSRE